MFSKKFMLDLAERSVSTFLQGFVAIVVVQGAFTKEALLAGAVAGGLAVLKGIGAAFANGDSGASLLSDDVVELQPPKDQIDL